MSDDPPDVPDSAPPLKERPAIRDRIREFPTTPGVYVMKDKKGVVVYVGKAANLRARLRSYFARSGGDERFFVKLLDQVLGDIEIVSTRTAQEALLVENELIKTHQPRFNVKLKDDKNFLNLRLSAAHPYPRLEVTRQRKKDGARYFGPYASATAIRKTLRLVNRFFQLRTCRDREFDNRSRPCLEYQIKRCPAPCVMPVPKEAYAASVRQVSLFLDGRGDELMGELRASMATAAEALEFERAAQLRDQARAIEQSLERQDVVMKTLADLDVFGIGREGPYVAIHIQKVRRGRITAAHALKLGKQEAPDDVLMEEFLARFYGPEAEIPPEVLLSVALPDQALTEELLTDRRGAKVELKVPERGERRRLVEGACKNAENALKLDQDKAERNREVPAQVERLASDPRANRVIDEFYQDFFRVQKLPDVNSQDGPTSYHGGPTYNAYNGRTSSVREAMQDELTNLGRWFTKTAPGTYDDMFRSNLHFLECQRAPWDPESCYGAGPYSEWSYGFDSEAGWDGVSEPVTLPEPERAGLLTRLALLAHDTAYARPIRRGLYIREALLCDPVPPPENCDVVKPPEIDVAMTVRQKVAAITEQPGTSCAGCHSTFINGFGHALGHFSSKGDYWERERMFSDQQNAQGQYWYILLPPEQWAEIDTHATTWLGGQLVTVNGPADVVDALTASGQLEWCWAREYLRFALGRVEASREDATVEALADEMRQGMTLDQAFRAVAFLPEFRALNRPITTTGGTP